MSTLEISNPAKTLTRAFAEGSRARRNALKGAVALDAVANIAQRNDILPALKFEQWPVSKLHAPSRQIRNVIPEHIAEIAQSIAAWGMVNPVLINKTGEIIDGVTTAAAARSLKLETVPCIVIDHLTQHEIRMLRLALNRLGEKGTWDIHELKFEFAELLEVEMPLVLAGFTLPEIDLVMAESEPAVDKKANACPAVDPDEKPVSCPGDLWQLGRHRVLCADATKSESYAALFGDAPLVRAVFTDPPNNIQIGGFAVGKGNIKHREFVAASGEMSDGEFITFLIDFLTAASARVIDGGVLFVCMDWRHAEHVHRAAAVAGLTMLNVAVWSKGNGGMGGLYRSAHEFVFVLKKGGGPFLNNIELGKHGRDRTNVWVYPGANQRGSSANAELANHPRPSRSSLSLTPYSTSLIVATSSSIPSSAAERRSLPPRKQAGQPSDSNSIHFMSI